jgi:ribosomal protein S27AE
MNQETPMTVADAPRFCPECGRAAAPSTEGNLCGHCGSTLAIQGYCPICEGRLRRRIGELCPKHDVKLVSDDAETRPQWPDGAPVSWVTVKVFPDTLAAAGARIRLEAEEIPTFLEGERMGAPGMYRVATGGVKLQVPAEFTAEARVILAQDWSWPDEDLGLDEELAADHEEPAASDPESPRRFFIELIVVLGLAIPLVAWLIIAYWQGE